MIDATLDDYLGALRKIESSNRYGITGATHPRMGRALGAYQVMESNLPSWSRAAVGREVSPGEFLRSPEIQDAVAKHRFGSYIQQTGSPDDAASMWLTGKPLAQAGGRRDVHGTDAPEYLRRFHAALGGEPAPRGGGGDAGGGDYGDIEAHILSLARETLGLPETAGRAEIEGALDQVLGGADQASGSAAPAGGGSGVVSPPPASAPPQPGAMPTAAEPAAAPTPDSATPPVMAMLAKMFGGGGA